MIDVAKHYALIAGFGLAFAAGWLAQGWRSGEQLAEQYAAHVDQLRQTAEANAAAIRQQQSERLALETRLDQLDTQSTEQLTHAIAENDRLERLYFAADDERKRLRIEVTLARNDATVSAATSACSVGDAASLELSPAAGRAVWDLRRALIADQAQIRYLQGYVCEIRGCP